VKAKFLIEIKDNSNIPNQYAKFKYYVKGEEELQSDKDHTYCFIYEHLEEAINTYNVYEYIHETEYNYWIPEHHAHASISISNTFITSV
jgi:hypothetical protein